MTRSKLQVPGSSGSFGARRGFDRSSVARGFCGVAAAVFTLLAACVGVASAGDRQTYEGDLTSERPGSPTGIQQEIHYVNPDDPEAKPHAVQDLTFVLPGGARIDTGVLPMCMANDLELMLQGTAACPDTTVLGGGSLSAQLGPGTDPLETETTFFNNEDELILLAETTNTGVPLRFVSRFTVGERSNSGSVPPLPGLPPPSPYLAIKDVAYKVNEITAGAGKSRRAYVTTPPRCPRSGHWILTAIFTYRDGVEQMEQSRTDCKPKPRRVRFKVEPRRVKRGERVRLVARLRPCPESAGDEVTFVRRRAGGERKRLAPRQTSRSCRAVMKRRVRKATSFRAVARWTGEFDRAVSRRIKVWAR